MLRLAKTAFLLLVLSLPLMKPDLPVGGLAATATDLLFVITAAALAIAVIRGESRLRWNPLYAVLLGYFGAMLLSAIGAEDPRRAWLKLATQAYLLSLPLLAATLIQTVDDLRAAFRAWIAATALVAAVGCAALLLFAAGVDRSLLGFALHEFGSLPPGDYPRLEATFRFPAMLCNYLTVSLMILFVSRLLGWVGAAAFWVLLAALLVTALFTLTPGLGGIFLALGLWGFVLLRARAAAPAVASLAAGTAAATAFLLAAAVTPILHPTAPFLIEAPGLDRELAPAVRMMTWIDAAQNFLEYPLLGVGIGADAVAVRYVGPSGSTHFLTDAHNAFLNFAVQCGLAGLAAMVLLVVWVAIRTGPLRLETGVLRLGLGLAWLNAFAYQGLTGSYEDARHLWLLLGLFLASDRLERTQHCSSSAVRVG